MQLKPSGLTHAQMLVSMQAADSKLVPRQSQQSDESETAASGPDSEAHGHESTHQISADVASTSPFEHDGAQPSTAASAKQDRQGAAASVAAETAEAAAQLMKEHAVATRSDQEPTASTTASMHIEQPGVSQPDVPGTLSVVLRCHAVVSVFIGAANWHLSNVNQCLLKLVHAGNILQSQAVTHKAVVQAGPVASSSPQHARKASRSQAPAVPPGQQDALHCHGQSLCRLRAIAHAFYDKLHHALLVIFCVDMFCLKSSNIGLLVASASIWTHGIAYRHLLCH